MRIIDSACVVFFERLGMRIEGCDGNRSADVSDGAELVGGVCVCVYVCVCVRVCV